MGLLLFGVFVNVGRPIAATITTEVVIIAALRKLDPKRLEFYNVVGISS